MVEFLLNIESQFDLLKTSKDIHRDFCRLSKKRPNLAVFRNALCNMHVIREGFKRLLTSFSTSPLNLLQKNSSHLQPPRKFDLTSINFREI